MKIDEKIEFIKGALEHVESRIAIMDQKASILMAIQAGFFVLITTVIKDYVGIFNNIKKTPLFIGYVSYGTLLIGLILSFFVVYYLILTIRPGKGLITNTITDEVTGKVPVINYLFWFKNKGEYLTDEKYLHMLDNLTKEDILNNYKKSHFTGLQLLSKKYHFYRKAIKGMNLFILLNFLGVCILVGNSFINYLISN